MSINGEVQKLGETQNVLLSILAEMESTYREYPEYNSIKMGLVSAVGEINSLRMKLVVKDDELTNRPKALSDGKRD